MDYDKWCSFFLKTGRFDQQRAEETAKAFVEELFDYKLLEHLYDKDLLAFGVFDEDDRRIILEYADIELWNQLMSNIKQFEPSKISEIAHKLVKKGFHFNSKKDISEDDFIGLGIRDGDYLRILIEIKKDEDDRLYSGLKWKLKRMNAELREIKENGSCFFGLKDSPLSEEVESTSGDRVHETESIEKSKEGEDSTQEKLSVEIDDQFGVVPAPHSPPVSPALDKGIAERGYDSEQGTAIESSSKKLTEILTNGKQISEEDVRKDKKIIWNGKEATRAVEPGIRTMALAGTPVPQGYILQSPLSTTAPMQDEAVVKKRKTEESLVSEHIFLMKNMSRGPVKFEIVVPNMPAETTWNLSGQTLDLTLSLTDTVASIKREILKITKLPTAKQKLNLEGLILKNNKTLAFYNFTSNTVLQLQCKMKNEKKN